MAYADDNVIKSQVATMELIPEIWSDEIVAAFKASLVLAPLVKNMSVVGQKGDIVRLPVVTRGSATAKSADARVTTIVGAGTGLSVNLDQHWHYARLIEDIATKQANSALRSFYTDDAGYSLGIAVDSAVALKFAALRGGDGAATWNKAVIGGDGSTDFVDASGNANATALTDAAIRRMIQTLDDNNVPQSQRYMVLAPVTRNTLMGLARFTEQAFVGENGSSNTIRNGRLGNVYGVELYINGNAPVPTSATTTKVGFLFHKEAVVLCMQMKPRVQTQYQLESLGDLLVADTIFGSGEMRDGAGVAFVVPA
jgi:N4-gp56 family major capsid protein